MQQLSWWYVMPFVVYYRYLYRSCLTLDSMIFGTSYTCIVLITDWVAAWQSFPIPLRTGGRVDLSCTNSTNHYHRYCPYLSGGVGEGNHRGRCPLTKDKRFASTPPSESTSLPSRPPVPVAVKSTARNAWHLPISHRLKTSRYLKNPIHSVFLCHWCWWSMDVTITILTDYGFWDIVKTRRRDISKYHSFLWVNFTAIGSKPTYR